MKLILHLLVCVVLMLGSTAFAQELGGAGTVQGVVKDSTGGVMVSVTVEITNPVSGFKQTKTTDGAGKFVFHNLAPNSYHVVVTAQGFKTFEKDVDVRSNVPMDIPVTMAIGGATSSVEVTGHADLVERSPVAHTDIDQTLVAKLPVEVQSGLNQAIMLASPGVVADSNGFMHPIGDHAQTQFSIDNQPVTDQQSRVYSNQISPSAVQSMEVITGVPPAEFGDKDSLVVRILTKSGLGQKRFGDVSASLGSFSTPSMDANVGAGSSTVGNFLSINGLKTDRFLDPPEFAALHDHGHTVAFFDRLDTRAGAGTLHINLQGARSNFNVPNNYDQDAAGQDQEQTINTYNVAPGYSQVIGSTAVLTINGYVRRDRVTYAPSADPFADTPATMAQTRTLTNGGGKVDVAIVRGKNTIKIGGTIGATRLGEDFTLGLTDPTFNSPCVNAAGDPSASTTLKLATQCAGAGLFVNSGFVDGLAAFDLSRGGSRFAFNDTATIKQQAAFIQDDITAGQVTFNVGLRFDHYQGLATTSLTQPRVGVAYQFKNSDTIVRASYGRTMETPYNENLLVSSSTGASGLADSVFGANSEQPLQPGKRDQFEAGVQQGFGKWVVVDVGYFRKKTTNAYDFDVLFDTPIVFPISWDHSEISGITGRVNLVEHGGFSAFMVLGHNVSRFFNPENGGILFDSPLPGGAFRIDHDQKFQQTTNAQYRFEKPHGLWAGLTWRYDSGLVAGSVPDFGTAMTLTADQQTAIGLFCGNTVATLDVPIIACADPNRGALRLRIPADGTEDDDTNPPRIAPRHLFDLAVGVDNLFGGKSQRVRLQFSVINLTNKEALYNFLSTFSGTHFVTPRTYKIQVGVTF
jgi:hypothetical protein